MRLARNLQVFRRVWRKKMLRLDLNALRLFIKFVPSEKQRVFILTIIIGALCGLAAVAFHLSIKFVEGYLIDETLLMNSPTWIFWLIFTPVLGSIFCGILLQYVVPEARGSGIPQVKIAYVVKGGKLSFLNSTIGKFIIGAVQIGSGSSLGREGPTVQICCGIASVLGRAAALSRQNLKQLLPVGAAAGIAAAFNAPIAAVTFTIEEIVGDLDQTILSGIVIAAALAAAIERSILGEHPVFDVPQGFGFHHVSSLISYVFLGIAAACVSVIFTESLLRIRKFFQKDFFLPNWAKPGIGGLITGILAVSSLYWLRTGGITGGGYEVLSQALSGNLALNILFALCIMKIIATIFSYGSGGAGGIFAPSLFIGGTLGGAVGFLDVAIFNHSSSEIGAFALVGMGAVFAGIVRAPITSVLIIFEMTGSYGLILPLMISNMMSYVISRHFRPTPIYEALLEQDGIFLPERKTGSTPYSLDLLLVSDAMSYKPISFLGDFTVKEALKQKYLEEYSIFPVIDNKNKFLGFVTKSRLRRTLAENGEEQKIKNLIYGKNSILSNQPLVNAIIKMNQKEIRHLAVLNFLDKKELIGILTMSDIMRVQGQMALNLDPSNKNLPELTETTVLLQTQPPEK